MSSSSKKRKTGVSRGGDKIREIRLAFERKELAPELMESPQREEFARKLEEMVDLTLNNMGLSDPDTVHEVRLMLPFCRILADCFATHKVDDWIGRMLNKLIEAPKSLQEELVLILLTLMSFVRASGVLALRQQFSILQSLSLDISRQLLSGVSSPAPLQVAAFSRFSVTAEHFVDLQEGLLRLCGLMAEDLMGCFATDNLAAIWEAACAALFTPSDTHHLVLSGFLCLESLGKSGLEMPLSHQDAFLRGLCNVLGSTFGDPSEQLDLITARCMRTFVPSICMTALQAARDSFGKACLHGIEQSRSPLLSAEILRCLIRIIEPGNAAQISIVESLVSVTDELALLSQCYLKLIPPDKLGLVMVNLTESVKVGNTCESLLPSCRESVFLARVAFGAKFPKEKLMSVREKLVSVFQKVTRKANPKDPSRKWSSHASVLFAFMNDCAVNLMVFDREIEQLLASFLQLGWLEAPVPESDEKTTQMALFCLRAAVVFGGRHKTVRAAIKAGIDGQRGNPKIFAGSIEALTDWSILAADPKTQLSTTSDLTSIVMTHEQKAMPPCQVANLLSCIGCCFCAMVDCPAKSLATSTTCSFGARLLKEVPPLRSFIKIIKDQSQNSVILVHTLQLFSRLFLHLSPEVLDAQLSKSLVEANIFHYAFHKDKTVRFAFADLVPALCQAFPDSMPALIRLLITHFKDASAGVETQCTILVAISKIAIFDQAEFLTTFSALIRAFSHKELVVRATAYDSVRDVARSQKLTEKALFQKHEDDVYTVLVENLADDRTLLEEVAQFLDEQPKELLRRTNHIWLPGIVVHPQADALLEVVVSFLDQSVGEFLSTHCVPVCLEILLERQNYNVERAVAYLSHRTTCSIDELIDSRSHDILYELVIMMGDSDKSSRKNVVSGLNKLAVARTRHQQRAKPGSGHVRPCNDSELADFLSSCFLAVVEQLDNLLISAHESPDERKHAVLGFDHLLELMAKGDKPHLNQLRPKIMATLKLALKQPELQLEACETFRHFLERLGLEDIEPVLGQIVGELLPYVTQDASDAISAQVVNILDWLLVEEAPRLKNSLASVHFLPDVPGLAAARNSLEKHQKKDRQGDDSGLDADLRQVKEGLQHESMNVRVMAVKKLSSLLQRNRSDVDNRILLGEQVSSSIAEILPHLLAGSRGLTSPDAKAAFAACLGLLGAIDPGRVQLLLRSEFTDQESDQDLAIQLLKNHLVVALEDARSESGSPTAFGRAAYAIQEVLKSCNMTDSTPDDWLKLKRSTSMTLSSKKRLAIAVWDKLDAKTQAVIRPYLSSCYRLSDPVAVDLKNDTFYKSRSTFRKWVGSFASFLISRPACQRLFSAVRSSVKDRDQIARYVLPHLIFRVATADEDRELIRKEICAVLKADESKSEDMAQLCSQTVFHLIDVMLHWIEKKREALQGSSLTAKSYSSSSRKRTKTSSRSGWDREVELDLPSDFAAVNALLSDIPQLLIATAALRCGAYARALKCVETHVRTQRKEKSSDAARQAVLVENVSILQRIFGGLEDSDCLEGLSKLRQAGTPEEQILEQEHLGKWAFSLDWYEGALRDAPRNADLRIGQLKCLLNLGQLEMAAALARNYRSMDLERTVGDAIVNAGSNRRESLLITAAAIVSSQGQSFNSMPGEDYESGGSMGKGRDGAHGRYQDPVIAAQLISCELQAAWRLSRWDVVDEVSASPAMQFSKDDFEVNVARCLLALSQGKERELSALLKRTRVEVMGPLLAASMDSYQRSYPYLVNLHLLSELEQMSDAFFARRPLVPDKRAWSARLKLTAPSFKVQHKILHLRRVVSQVKNIGRAEAAKFWVDIARAARRDGQLEASRSALVQASTVDPGDLSAVIERAKLLYLQGKRQQGILEVQRVISLAPTDWAADQMSDEFEISKKQAKPELLLARWLQETGQKPFDGIKSQYEKVTAICPQWESGFFYLASYLDEVMKSYVQDHSSGRAAEEPLLKEALALLPEILAAYRRALQNGYKHIHQSLPRMLSLYFQYARLLKHADNSRSEEIKKIEEQMHKTMVRGLEKIPEHVWLSAMPQIISRVCHDNESLKKVFLEPLIARVFRAYPAQVMWFAVSVVRSKGRENARRALRKILEKQRVGEFKTIYDQTIELAKDISILCQYKPSHTASTKMDINHVPELSRLKHIEALKIVVPKEATIMGRLPVSSRPEKGWNPFGEAPCVTIQKLEPSVEVIRSLQSPKIFAMLGSDGKQYRFLAKPDDDLRKDSRVMEVNSLCNKLLARDNEARKRQLRITTFSVIPLDEKNGLIEWVPDLVPYRTAVQQQYPSAVFKDMKAKYEGELKKFPPEVRYEKLMFGFPLRFHQWFVTQFPEPMSWLDARLAYTHSCAVMSIVGTVIGLGDRHGENILLHRKGGHVVHVDFNAIFNKAELFQVPERVPFRLTRNMVDAMGLLGVEGGFRRVCEITMGVLRDNREMVLSVLETFLYDPLVEFAAKKDPSDKSHKKARTVASSSSSSMVKPGSEPINAKAREIVQMIERRLLGKIDRSKWEEKDKGEVQRAVALSVEGHIEHLIHEATSAANLGAMYVGWSCWT